VDNAQSSLNSAVGDAAEPIGIIVVDHGSRRAASNDMLLDVVRLFQQHSPWEIVEPAHMELAEPSIATAFARCAARGARTVVVHPYFLLPGRHSTRDIPEIVGEVARQFPHVDCRITEPLGLHPLMAGIISQRVRDVLAHD
jgi:sirohydrochlorin ferrochelatase